MSMSKEKAYSPVSGYLVLFILAVVAVICLAGLIGGRVGLFGWLLTSIPFLAPGFFFVNPNNSVVLVLFGDYRGTVKQNGLP